MRDNASVQPPNAAVHCFAKPFRIWMHRRNHVIQLHYHIRTNIILNLHRAFRGQHQHLLGVRVLEFHTLLGDLRQCDQRHHLKSTRIGQQCVRPAHKIVQSTSLLHNLLTRSHAEVVGVAQKHSTASLLHLVHRNTLHCALRADGHVHGCRNCSMRKFHFSSTRF